MKKPMASKFLKAKYFEGGVPALSFKHVQHGAPLQTHRGTNPHGMEQPTW